MAYQFNPPGTEELRRMAMQRLSQVAAPNLDARSPAQWTQLLEDTIIRKLEVEIQNEYLQEQCDRLNVTLAETIDLYDTAPIGLIRLDPVGRVNKLNQAAVSLLCQDRQGVLGKALVQLFSADQGERVRRLVESADPASTVHPGALPAHVQAPSGETRHLQLSIAPQPRGQGQVVAVHDNGTQQAAHDHMQHRIGVLLGALDACADGYWEWDLAQGRMHYSGALAERYGVANEALGSNAQAWQARVHPQDHAALQVALAQSLADPAKPLRLTLRWLDADGQWLWVRCQGLVSERNATGAATRMLGTHTDLSAERHLQDALATADGVLQALFDGLPQYLAVLDGRGHVLRTSPLWNAYALRVGRAYQDGFVGLHYAELLDAVTGGVAETRQAILAAVSEVTSGRAIGQQWEYSFQSEQATHWFGLQVMAVRAGAARAVVSHQELTRYRAADQASVPTSWPVI